MEECRYGGVRQAVKGDRPISSGMRLREKYEILKSMRSNETQEALGRECQLSYIITELKKRINEMEASRNCEREAHKRESFYLIKENECMKEQIRVLEKKIGIVRKGHDADVSQLREKTCAMETQLADERVHYVEQKAAQDRVVQHLCSSLYTTQRELERYDEENKRLVVVQRMLGEMILKFASVQRECSLWKEVQQKREELLLQERNMFIELQCYQMRERMDRWQYQKQLHSKHLEVEANHVVNSMRDGVGMYVEMKRLLLEDAVASTEKEVLLTENHSKSLEIRQMCETHVAIELRLKQCLCDLERNQEEYLEQVASLKALDDATLSYVLRQRDEEVANKLRTWKDALLKAHELLRALLMRYEPFQREDEVFVTHVIECLSSAPHVKDPVNVWLD